MAHFGIICPPATGHLNALTALGRELQSRGHRVTIVNVLDTEQKAHSAGLGFRAIAESESPRGTMAQVFEERGKLSGLAALQHTINSIQRTTAIVLQHAPKAIQAAGIDALLVDQLSPAGGTIADYLGIPFISVCAAVVLNEEVSVPPTTTTWKYSSAGWAKVRNYIGYRLVNRIRKPIEDTIDEYRHAWNLPSHHSPDEAYSQFAQLCQQPAEFEFPRENLPPWFHFTGAYHTLASRESIDFPFAALTGQPLIYASMGTLQNRLMSVFEMIAEACLGLDAQLVISLGREINQASMPKFPGSPLVVGQAPQLELLQRASLTITHAGLNTALESISHGVPMVAIPITNDQPGVAARIVWTGCGEMIKLSGLNVAKLRSAIERVLTQDSYRNHVTRLQIANQQAGGVVRGANLIEQVVSTGKPVVNEQMVR